MLWESWVWEGCPWLAAFVLTHRVGELLLMIVEVFVMVFKHGGYFFEWKAC